MDYAASTPMAPEAIRATKPYFSQKFGNPGSAHWFGQEASAAVYEARRKIAAAIGADYKDIIFTGSASEANSLALKGAVVKNVKNKKPARVVVSAFEHQSVMEACRDLEGHYGAEVVYIPISREGIIDVKKLKSSLNKNTILVSVMYANSEIGTIQPIEGVAKIIKDFRGNNIYPLFHSDAVQAFQYLRCDVEKIGVDFMTLSAHKIYGPKGIGILYTRDKGLLSPLISGSSLQEYGLRGGTENTPYIIAFGVAVELAEKTRIKEAKRVGFLRNYLWQGIKKILPNVELNGSLEKRLPNNLNIYFPGRPAQDLLIELDLMGVAVSSGMACSARSVKPSYVIESLGYSGDRPYSSLRFSLGRQTTKKEIDFVLDVFKKRFGSN